MKIMYGCRVSAEKKKLMDMICEITGLTATYQGPPAFAYHIGEYTVDREGNLNTPNTEDAKNLVESLLEEGFEGELSEEWSFEQEALVEENEEALEERNSNEEQIEEENTENNETAAEQESEERADADIPDADHSGLTISFPRSMVSDADLAKIKKLVEGKQVLIKKALGADSLDIQVDDEKVAFPWFSTLPDGESANTYMRFVQKLCELAINQKRITTKEKPAENEKYAFRCFLLRLGFIGDEFKQDRKILMKNLDGSASFKHGRPEPAAPERTVEVTA